MGILGATASLHLTRDHQGRRIYKGGAWWTRDYLIESPADEARVLELARIEIVFGGILLVLLTVTLAAVEDATLRWSLGAALVVLLALAYGLCRRRVEATLKRAD